MGRDKHILKMRSLAIVFVVYNGTKFVSEPVLFSNVRVQFKCWVKVRGVGMSLLEHSNVWESGQLEQHFLRGAAPNDLQVEVSLSRAEPVVGVNRQCARKHQ